MLDRPIRRSTGAVVARVELEAGGVVPTGTPSIGTDGAAAPPESQPCSAPELKRCSCSHNRTNIPAQLCREKGCQGEFADHRIARGLSPVVAGEDESRVWTWRLSEREERQIRAALVTELDRLRAGDSSQLALFTLLRRFEIVTGT